MNFNLAYANPVAVHEAEWAIQTASPGQLCGLQLMALNSGQSLLQEIVSLDPSGSNGNGCAQATFGFAVALGAEAVACESGSFGACAVGAAGVFGAAVAAISSCFGGENSASTY